MTKQMISLTDAITGENIVREMNDEELNYQSQMQAEVAAEDKAKKIVEIAKLKALAKLETLGLTSDDLKALGL